MSNRTDSTSLGELRPHPNAAQRVTAERNLRKLAACLPGEWELKEGMPSSGCGHTGQAGRKALHPAQLGQHCLVRAVVVFPAHGSTMMSGSWTFDHSLGRGTEAQVPPLSRKTRESTVNHEPPRIGIRPPTLPLPALHQIGDFLTIRPRCLRVM